jgi:prepilin-type N-terminal cleavage/methylation domain-containing protein
MHNRQNGFSLIELLIVVVVVGILAALAVAGFFAARRSANESSAVSSLRLLHGAQMTYATSFGNGDFAGDIGAGTTNALSTLHGLGLIDDVLASGTKSGYNFVGGREVRAESSPAQFFFSFIPISNDPIAGTGHHRYGISTDGVVRKDTTTGAHYANAAALNAAPALE